MSKISQEELEQMLAAAGLTPEDMVGRLDQHRKNEEYLEREWTRLVAEHPNQWVLVAKEEVVEFADSLEAIAQELQHYRQENGDPSSVIKFLDPDPRPLILVAA